MTTPTENVVAEWRAAMEGVTPGPWRIDHNHIHYVVCDHAPMVISFNRQAPTDSAWIARCSPSGISELLALIESQRAELAASQARVTALEAEKAGLREAVKGAIGIIENCNVEAGVCCCGDSMATHQNPMACGHSPIDHGAYVAGQWLNSARAALSRSTEKNDAP